jgi:Zn-dependent protease with chaperone function
VAALAGTRAARRIADRWRLGILPGPGPVLCNVGFFRPRILVSRGVLELLDPRELAAALAHELAHVVRRDNLKRAVAEVLCFAAPVVVWWADSFRLAVSPRSEFLSVLLIGAAAGILTRMVIVPALAYWQERRCDEWAALAVGDRLAVASALVKIAAAKAQLPGSPLLSAAFAFYHAPVSTRVRRLVNGSGRLLLGVDRVTRLTLRLAAVTFFVLATLAIERAESRGLKGHVEIRSCQVGVVVRS